MLSLDHFVVHVQGVKVLPALRDEIEPLGFPFDLQSGKGTKGFKATNIWIGRQYFEIIRLLRPDGGGWVPRWVERYNRGIFGLYCIFLVTDHIGKMADRLRTLGIAAVGPERISFKAFFGLFKKTLPWQVVYLPPIPSTELEIGFIQYDPDPQGIIKQYLVPNSEEYGITGIHSAKVQIPLTEEARTFLKKTFQNGTVVDQCFNVPLSNGNLAFEPNAEGVVATLFANASDPARRGKKFVLLNTIVQT